MKNLSKRFSLFVVALFLLPLTLNAQWIQTNGPHGGYINSLVVSGTDIFATTDAGLFHSTNDATNWNPITNGLPSNKRVIGLAISGIYFFATTDSNKFYRSSNYGSSWEVINS